MEQGEDPYELSGYHGYWIGNLCRMLLSVCLSVSCAAVCWICVAFENQFLEGVSGHSLTDFPWQLLSLF